MTGSLQENVWLGLQRESFVPISGITIPAQEVQGHTSQYPDFVGQFRARGHLEIPNSPFNLPDQDFIITFTPDGDVIENKPADAWPKIRFELSLNQKQGVLKVNVLLSPSEDSVEAELLYTRVWYTLVKVGECRFRSSDINLPLTLRIEPEAPDEVNKVLFRAKVCRKLAFLERIFKRNFHFPRQISAEEIRKVEIIFRGITEGEFAIRGSDITFENVIPSELNLNAPPFSEPGPFTRLVGDREYLFGHWIDLGKLIIKLNHAELANPRILKRMADAPNQPVNLRFIVPDHQIIHSFSSYIAMPEKLRSRRLKEFIRYLSQSEPPELADSIKELLVSNLSAESAIQITSDWLMLNQLPDRFSAQKPELNTTAAYWRVPVYFVYSGGQHGLVGEVDIDIKTGAIKKATPIDELLEKAEEVSERIIHAR
jgi:hypothetical protein